MTEQIAITFKNDVSEQTHVFQKVNLQQEGFFVGLLSNPMLESKTGKATILFSTGVNKTHQVSFPFMENLFSIMEKLFETGDVTKVPFSGKFIYQMDKILDYFLCTKYKAQIFEKLIDKILPAKVDPLSAKKDKDGNKDDDNDDNTDDVTKRRKIGDNIDLTADDMVYIILTLYDNKGYQTTKEWLNEWFRGLKSLDIFYPLFQSLKEFVNESEYYTTEQTIQIMQLMNVVRNTISATFLQDTKLSQVLLMHPSDVEEYLVYEEPPTSLTLYFPKEDMKDSKDCKYTEGQTMILSEDEARLRFTLISQGKLQKMPWNNVIVAGGSVNLMLDATLNPGDFPASDIDLFVYGQTKEERAKAVIDLLNYFDTLTTARKFYVVRQSVVSIYIDDCPTTFQIIAGNAATILDVLHHFDMDHLRMAYQNGQFYMTLEAVEALKRKTTYVHGYGTNIYRIWKMINRGYNLVDNGDLILNTDSVDFLEPERYGRPQSIKNETKLDIKNLKTKFGFDKYKYYVPRKEESDEKIMYEIHLHTKSKLDKIVRTVSKVMERMELEGNFKTQIGCNGYMGNLAGIREENIIFKNIGRDTLKYMKILYRHRDGLGKRESYITYRSPAAYIEFSGDPARNGRGEPLNDMTVPTNWRLTYENKDYVSFVYNQSEKILLKAHSDSNFKQWYEKKRNGVSYLSKIFKDNGTFLVKIRPANLTVVLSNGEHLNDKQKLNILENKGFNHRKVKCDIYLDKLCYAFNNTDYFFVYTIKTIRLMEEVHSDTYNVAKVKPTPVGVCGTMGPVGPVGYPMGYTGIHGATGATGPAGSYAATLIDDDEDMVEDVAEV